MARYLVTCSGVAREVYSVVAESEEEAKERWSEGTLVVSEVESAEPISVALDDD